MTRLVNLGKIFCEPNRNNQNGRMEDRLYQIIDDFIRRDSRF